ncbi:SLBB domain-containing protein [Solitalea koreensis]|uniref:Protein involved in polysaccharide export, contains SLBB domain of the beta-grasp fold n=1 Tax=Solitalea koreensis TaxID=543615 RepID=A0A521CNG8_9SPHI|nr:SLBB domain-containing protein [Solitalea koreensis]SMO60938.1 protein involved in polysaccharide export, contains SLBB domain of the beta-grasp fold [Solitalea koreensis]
MNIKFRVLINIVLLTLIIIVGKPLITLAQTGGISIENLASVKVDNLSDDQIRKFVTQAQNSGLNESQLEQLAQQKGMPATEIAKLKERIAKLGGITTQTRNGDKSQKTNRTFDQSELGNNPDSTLLKKKSKVFGAELFNNKSLSFEPNLKLATPGNYQIGPEDELVIDIYGNSEATYRLQVSPEGSIRIPYLGPVYVNGLTIDQARTRINNQLASIYSGIKSKQTSVNITLGNIRTIKVTLIGEIKLPGTYTLPSLATVFNALYASGGPNDNGSFRNIKVIRDSKVVAVIDIYDFLLKGSQSKNIRLQDQDVIKVSPYQTRVELTGEVKRPAIYETLKSETLEDVFNFAGGFTDNAYRDMVKVVRNTAKEKSVADVPATIFGMFTPQTGDVYTIEKILDRFANRIRIGGAVFRPGTFALENNMTLTQLIKKAEGPREDAFMNRATINRLKGDLSPEVIAFDLNKILDGTQADIVLKREDSVFVSSKFDLREEYSLSIDGEVLRPGTYDFADHMSLNDMILLAGGIKESASLSRIEIARRMKNVDSLSKRAQTAQLYNFSITKDLKDNPEVANFILQPFDEIHVRPAPGYEQQKKITIEGEVLYPGNYTIINKGDRISDVIKRSGGLSAIAFPEGAVLLRKQKLTETDKMLKRERLNALIKQSRDTSAVIKELTKEEKAKGGMGEKTEMIELAEKADLLGINLPKILEKPGSKFDILLEDGDVIKVPKELQTVQVKGEVLYPILIRYSGNKGFRDYISNAGGFSIKALKRKSYIVYANGTVASTKKFLFFSSYPSVKPGAEIYVPAREEKERMSTGAIVGITSSIASLAVVLVSLFK